MKNENCDRKSTCDDYKYNHCDGCGANKPKGDLISRSELKKHKFTIQIRNGVAIEEIEVVSVASIDNAPTVEQKYYERIIAQINPVIDERPQGEWVRKEDVIHHIEKQYSEHNELVPIWLSIGDLKGGAE